MIYIIMAAVLAAAVYFCIRWQSLKSTIRQAKEELVEITDNLEQNRIVKLTSPHRELEDLMAEINRNLEKIRKERIKYREQERELQKQVENISHDLRTPLTAIIGYLDFMDEETMDEQTKESLEIIRRKTRALKKLTAQFYDLSRITAGDYAVKCTQVDLGRKLRELTVEHYQQLQEQNLHVEIDIPEHPVNVLGDEEAFERIFSNLFTNARRYACSMLKVQMTEEGEKVKVLFENDTKDLTYIDAKHLFDRFYTGDASRSSGGTGLGLTIAKFLTDAMEGDIYAKLQQKEGEKRLQIIMEMKAY